MAISNKFGLMVVTTGNKSEMSVGYATLYGDMNGGFNPIKDLYKTEVYRLSRLRNGWKPDDALGPDGPVIPESILTRPPTAELRENQTDQDSLPPYDVLDAILERLVEREEPIASIVAAGFDRETVMKIERMLNLAEYKRRQAAPGVKVTLKNFGRDRRYPIVNRFRDPAPLPEPDARWSRQAARPRARRSILASRHSRMPAPQPGSAGSVSVPRGHSSSPQSARGRNVGPTVRTCRLPGALCCFAVAQASRPGGLRGSAPWAARSWPRALPRWSAAARALGALLGHTMSPRSTVWSSRCLSASAQVWPARLQLQVGLKALR